MLTSFKTRQNAGAGSAYVAGSFFVSGLLTYVFQGLSARYLGEAGYGDLIMLWSMTFLVVQVLWIGVTQTLGRFVSERLSRGEDPRPVISSVKRLQLALLVAFVVVAGVGVLGPALAIVLAPLVAVVVVRPTPEAPPEGESGPFSAAKAFRFTGPVLLCVAFAQI